MKCVGRVGILLCYHQLMMTTMMVMMIMMTIDFDENDDEGNGKYPFDNLAAGG